MRVISSVTGASQMSANCEFAHQLILRLWRMLAMRAANAAWPRVGQYRVRIVPTEYRALVRQYATTDLTAPSSPN